MGDRRFRAVYERFVTAPDRVVTLRSMRDHEILQALAGAAVGEDPLTVNVLATEALNRERRQRAARAGLALALVTALSLTAILVLASILRVPAPLGAPHPGAAVAVLAASGLAGYWRWKRPRALDDVATVPS